MFSLEELADATLIHVPSDLDAESSKELDSLIRVAEGSGRQRVIVSFASGRYCFSPGLAVLSRAHQRIGSRLVIVAPPVPRFWRPFEVTGLSRLLRIEPTIELALHSRERVSRDPAARLTPVRENA
jgi:anti-anti-sigma factor